jgi:hypothetical protein
MEHRYAGYKIEITNLAREILRAEGCTRSEAMLCAQLLVNGSHEYTRRRYVAQAHERATVELTRENAFPAWACRPRPDDLFKDEG